jgi:cobalt-zinc-cadmium resistance protein CzcA
MSTGIGSQVQRPLALVVVGGSLLAPVLILVVLPVLLFMFSRRVAPYRPPETSGHFPGVGE